MTSSLRVAAAWDDEAGVWVATSDDVPGLATEAETLDRLVEKLKSMVPELLEANGCALGEEVTFQIVGERIVVVHRHAA